MIQENNFYLTKIYIDISINLQNAGILIPKVYWMEALPMERS